MMRQHSAWLFFSLLGIVLSAPSFAETKTGKVTILKTFPHDPQNWTEGLVFSDGKLYEGTGLIGDTHLDEIEPGTGRVLKSVPVDGLYGEGITIFQNHLIELTYTEGVGLIYDLPHLNRMDEFRFQTSTHEGWGLTQDGTHLIVSDGSSTLTFIDPDHHSTLYTLQVSDDHGPVDQLNELEYVNGVIFANRWLTDEIVAIDSVSGNVLARFDCTDLQKEAHSPDAILNGIAYRPDSNTFYLTGKTWNTFFEVSLTY